MIKILFVCLGNICRSPLAMAILREKLKERGLEAEVDSAGFEDYHVGDPADPRSVDIAAKHGIDLGKHEGRQFHVSDFDKYDRIYVMDSSNYADVLSVARNEADAAKVDYVLNMAHPGKDLQVPDPYYGGRDGFQKVYEMLELACERMADEMEEIEKQKKKTS